MESKWADLRESKTDTRTADKSVYLSALTMDDSMVDLMAEQMVYQMAAVMDILEAELTGQRRVVERDGSQADTKAGL